MKYFLRLDVDAEERVNYRCKFLIHSVAKAERLYRAEHRTKLLGAVIDLFARKKYNVHTAK